MRKRVVSVLVVTIMTLMCCANAFAVANNPQPYAKARLYGGLSPQGSNRYLLWGTIRGESNDDLSIRVELRSSSGNYITSVSNSGDTASVTASTPISLSSGTYYIYLYGTTSTSSPSDVLTVRI